MTRSNRTAPAATTPLPRCDPRDVKIDRTRLESIEAYIVNAIERHSVPGAVVLASRGRQVFYEAAWGTAARPDGSRRKLHPSLRQPFFSFSKIVSTTVACRVHAQGLFDWDDPVEKYIPGFATHGKAGTTIRHLLSHSAGLPQYYPPLDNESDWTAAIAELSAADAAWPPGTASGYHPVSGHLLAGSICAAVTKRTFSQLCRELLDAIGAFTTELRPAAPDDDVAVIPAPGRPGPGPEVRDWQPGGGCVGPPEDILRVIHLHLDRGAEVVPWSSLREMHAPQFAAELESGNDRFQGWALGWMLGYGSIGSSWAPWLGLGEHARANTFTHGGFSSLHALGDPDRDLAVAVCLSDAPIDPEGNASDELAAEARVVIGDAFLAACGT